MTEMTDESQIGPPKISFPSFILKVLAALAGGVVGSAILLVIVLLTSPILIPITEGEEYVSPIFIFIVMLMIFISSTVGNILSTFLTYLTERDKYQKISSALYQVFIISVIIFLLMVPVYFITSSINVEIVAYAIGLHVIVSAQVSALILEIVSNYRYALLGVYGVTFSILASAAIMFGLTGLMGDNPSILLFAALPVVWGSIGFVQSIVTMIYGWIARIYDKDFLAADTAYGKDYGKEIESEAELIPKTKDEEGADFLRHN